jgi:hypothetical protein
VTIKLSEADWAEVFKLRCRSKEGRELSKAERRLVDRAWKEDPKRYKETEADVFDATVPFGSTARAKR